MTSPIMVDIAAFAAIMFAGYGAMTLCLCRDISDQLRRIADALEKDEK